MRLCISCIDTLCTVNLGCGSTMFDNEKHENQENNANFKTKFEQVSIVLPKVWLKWMVIWYWFGILGLQKRVMQNDSYLELLTEKAI